MAGINAGLYGEVVKRSALQGFVDALLPVSAFAMDVSAEEAVKHQSVTVPLIGNRLAKDFAGNYITGAGGDADPVTVTLNVHKYDTVKLTDKEAMMTPVQLEMFGYQAGQAIGLGMLQDFLGLITAQNYGAPVFTGGHAAFDSDDVVDIKIALDDAKVAIAGRNLVLASAYTGALLKDDSIKTVANLGNDEAIRNGMFTKLSNFRMFESGIVPANGEHLVGFAGVPAGMAIAMRYVKPQDGHTYSMAEALVDDQTGIVLGVREWYDNNTGTKYLAFDALGGKSVGIAGGLKRIVSE